MAANLPPYAIAGDPGERWTNNGDKAQWQFVCSFINSCGRCAQYHMAIARWWAIPLHVNCACRQVAIPPGATSEPFVDFRDEIAKLPEWKQYELVGKANWQLIEKGVIEWDDVVGRSRIKPLWEVVQRKKLNAQTLTKAGVAPATARRAVLEATNPDLAASHAAQNRVLLPLKAAGWTDEQIRQEIASRLAARFGIVGPPTPQGSFQVPRPPMPPAAPAAAAPVSPKPPPVAPGATVHVAEPPKIAAVGYPVPRATLDMGQGVPAAAKAVLGRDATRGELLLLAGGRDGSTVTVTAADGSVTLAAEGKHLATVVEVYRDGVARVARIAHLASDDPAETFGRIVQAAIVAGVDQIRVRAADHAEDSVGYHVWPEWGFDANLTASQRDAIRTDPDAPESIRNVTRVSQVIATEAGSNWWRKHGTALASAVFSLKPGSEALKRWTAVERRVANKRTGRQSRAE